MRKSSQPSPRGQVPKNVHFRPRRSSVRARESQHRIDRNLRRRRVEREQRRFMKRVRLVTFIALFAMAILITVLVLTKGRQSSGSLETGPNEAPRPGSTLP